MDSYDNDDDKNEEEDMVTDVDEEEFEDSGSEESSTESESGSEASAESDGDFTEDGNELDEHESEEQDEESDTSEEDEESEDSESEKADKVTPSGHAMPSCSQTGYDSEGSDGASERCPVCLGRITNQNVGTPESCDHNFCLECILEWSKNVNTCPVDRQVFHLILAKHSVDGTVYKQIPVEDRQLEEEVEEDPTYCEMCGHSDREDRMLLCDGCDLGYHMECLDPPLDRVPVEEWFCPDCEPPLRPQRRRSSTRVDDDVTLEILQVTYVRRTRHPRQVARTRISERVRATIAERRRANRIISDSEDDIEVTVHPSTSTTRSHSRSATKKTTKRKTTKRKTTKKRKRTTRKRKGTTRKKTTKGRKKRKGTKKGKTKKKGGRKTRKTARIAKATPKTTKVRLAGRLGIAKPPAGRMIPTVKSRSSRTLENQLMDVGAASLSIFGSRDALDPFVEDNQSDDDQVGSTNGSTLVARPAAIRTRVPTKAALKSHGSIGPWSRSNTRGVFPGPVGQNLSPFDLLGSIMNSQEKLHLKSEDVTIRKDGSLEAKKQTKRENGLLKSSNSKKLSKGQQLSYKVADGEGGSGETGGGNDQNQSSPGQENVNVTESGDGCHHSAEGGANSDVGYGDGAANNSEDNGNTDYQDYIGVSYNEYDQYVDDTDQIKQTDNKKDEGTDSKASSEIYEPECPTTDHINTEDNNECLNMDNPGESNVVHSSLPLVEGYGNSSQSSNNSLHEGDINTDQVGDSNQDNYSWTNADSADHNTEIQDLAYTENDESGIDNLQNEQYECFNAVEDNNEGVSEKDTETIEPNYTENYSGEMDNQQDEPDMNENIQEQYEQHEYADTLEGTNPEIDENEQYSGSFRVSNQELNETEQYETEEAMDQEINENEQYEGAYTVEAQDQEVNENEQYECADTVECTDQNDQYECADTVECTDQEINENEQYECAVTVEATDQEVNETEQNENAGIVEHTNQHSTELSSNQEMNQNVQGWENSTQEYSSNRELESNDLGTGSVNEGIIEGADSTVESLGNTCMPDESSESKEFSQAFNKQELHHTEISISDTFSDNARDIDAFPCDNARDIDAFPCVKKSDNLKDLATVPSLYDNQSLDGSDGALSLSSIEDGEVVSKLTEVDKMKCKKYKTDTAGEIDKAKLNKELKSEENELTDDTEDGRQVKYKKGKVGELVVTVPVVDEESVKFLEDVEEPLQISVPQISVKKKDSEKHKHSDEKSEKSSKHSTLKKESSKSSRNRDDKESDRDYHESSSKRSRDDREYDRDYESSRYSKDKDRERDYYYEFSSKRSRDKYDKYDRYDKYDKYDRYSSDDDYNYESRSKHRDRGDYHESRRSKEDRDSDRYHRSRDRESDRDRDKDRRHSRKYSRSRSRSKERSRSRRSKERSVKSKEEYYDEYSDRRDSDRSKERKKYKKRKDRSKDSETRYKPESPIPWKERIKAQSKEKDNQLASSRDYMGSLRMFANTLKEVRNEPEYENKPEKRIPVLIDLTQDDKSEKDPSPDIEPSVKVVEKEKKVSSKRKKEHIDTEETKNKSVSPKKRKHKHKKESSPVSKPNKEPIDMFAEELDDDDEGHVFSTHETKRPVVRKPIPLMDLDLSKPVLDTDNPLPDVSKPPPDLGKPLDEVKPDLAKPPPSELYKLKEQVDLNKSPVDFKEKAERSMLYPDVSKPPPDMSKSLPDMSKPPPDMSKPPPDMSKPPPDMSKPLPDMSQPPPDMSKPPPELRQPSPDLNRPTLDLQRLLSDVSRVKLRVPNENADINLLQSLTQPPPMLIHEPQVEMNVNLDKITLPNVSEMPPPNVIPAPTEAIYDPSMPTENESPPPNFNVSIGGQLFPANVELHFSRPQDVLPPVSSVGPTNLLLPRVGPLGMLSGQVRTPSPLMVNPVLMPGHPALRGLQRLPQGFVTQNASLPLMAGRFPGAQNGIPIQGQPPPGSRVQFELRPGLLEMPPPPLHMQSGEIHLELEPNPTQPNQGPSVPGLSIPGHHQPSQAPLLIGKPPDLDQLTNLINVHNKLGQVTPLQPVLSVPSHSSATEMQRFSETVFKVPLPPAPILPEKTVKFKTDSPDQAQPVAPPTSTTMETTDVVDMEVVDMDMDVASPLEDEDFGVSFSPPDIDVMTENSEKIKDDASKEDIPASAVELDVQSKFMKKLNRQERVVEEVKLAIKPHYSKGKIDKNEYKEIMRKAVPKICHSKKGDINPIRIRQYIEKYVTKMQQARKWEARKQKRAAKKKNKMNR